MSQLPIKPFLFLHPTPGNLSLFLDHRNLAAKYSALEVLITLYPLRPEVTADHFRFEPFEDYAADLTAGKHSSYRLFQEYNDKVFGSILSLLIGTFFYFFAPNELGTVEAIVAILGAYAIGKELWADLDRMLQVISREWRIKWTDDEYVYVREDFGTIQRFWQMARQQRYGYSLILPRTFDLITHSNSKTIEMAFNQAELAQLSAEKVRILTTEFKTSSPHAHSLKALMFGAKVNFVKKFGLVKIVTEFYQGLNQGKAGTLDSTNRWTENTILVKKFFIIGKIKIHLQTSKAKGTLFLFQHVPKAAH